MTTSTDLDDTLANIRARAEAATEGPWDLWLGPDWIVLGPNGHREIARVPAPCNDNAVFIASARTDVSRLLDLIDEQRAVIARVRALASEWAHQPTDYDEDTEQQIADGHALLAALDGADTKTTTDGDAVREGDTHA